MIVLLLCLLSRLCSKIVCVSWIVLRHAIVTTNKDWRFEFNVSISASRAGETPHASAELVIVQPSGQRKEQELIHWQSGPCGVTKKQKQKQNVSGTQFAKCLGTQTSYLLRPRER